MCFRLVPKSATLNDLEQHNSPTLRYFIEFGSFRGQLRKSGCLAINRFSPEKCHKVYELSTTDVLCFSRQRSFLYNLSHSHAICYSYGTDNEAYLVVLHVLYDNMQWLFKFNLTTCVLYFIWGVFQHPKQSAIVNGILKASVILRDGLKAAAVDCLHCMNLQC